MASSPSRAACIHSSCIGNLRVRHERSHQNTGTPSCVLCTACSVLDSREHVRDGAWGEPACARACVLGRGAVVVAQFCGAGRRVRMRPAPPFTPHAGAPAPPTPAVCTVCSLGVNPVGEARAFFTGVVIGRGLAQVRASGGLVRCAVHTSICSACRCSQWVELWLPRPPRLHVAACVRVCDRRAGGRVAARRRRALEMVQSATGREARRLHITQCSLQRKQREGIRQNVRDSAGAEGRCGQNGVPYRAPLLGPQKSSAR